VNDDELLFEAPLEIVGEEHRRHPGTAVDKKHYRLLAVDTSDKEILGVAVDIEFKKFGD